MRNRMDLLVVALVLSNSGSASAQSAEAETLFNEGDRLMAAGKVAEACEAFDGSNRIEPRAGTLIRIGECREKNGQLASAWSAYKDAQTRAKDPRKRDIAIAKAAELVARQSYLTISVPDESHVDGLVITLNGKPIDPALWNRAVPVDGGNYVVAGRAPGNDEWKTSVVVPSEHGTITVEVPKLKDLTKLVSPGPKPAAEKKPSDEEPSDDEPELRPVSRFTTRRKIAIGVAGVGVASLATGIALGVAAKAKQQDAFALCSDPQIACTNAFRADALAQTGHRFAVAADIAFGVAGIATIGAAVLWITGASESRHRLAIVPAANSITVVGRF
jgi:hypothetical protein